MKRLFSLLALGAVLCLPACSMLGLKTLSVEEARKQPYRLRTGDEIEITLGGRADSLVKTAIGEDGTALYPGLELIPATGKSLRELEAEIEKQFALRSAVQFDPASSSLKNRILSPAEAFNQTYQLQVGDQLEISVWEHPELSQKIQIREDGTFPFPLLGTLRAAGRTTSKMEKEIRRRLDQDYIVNPQVTLRLIGAQFTVLGQEGDSGSYPIEGGLDLLTAISKAGDILTLRTSPVEILRRQGNTQVVIRANVDRLLNGEDPNIPVLPRDTIYVKPPLTTVTGVPSISDRKIAIRLIGAKFTALGEVSSPGTYPIESTMDVLTAISLAGGISKFGSSHIEIIRAVGNQRVVIRANLDRILKGRDSNFPILPRDTLYARRRLF